jgi:hypothetical protein
MPVCPEKSLDQNIFCVLAVAADAQHLTVDGVLVLIRQRLEVHRVAYASIVPLEQERSCPGAVH